MRPPSRERRPVQRLAQETTETTTPTREINPTAASSRQKRRSGRIPNPPAPPVFTPSAPLPAQSIRLLLVKLKYIMPISPSLAKFDDLAVFHKDLRTHFVWHSQMLHHFLGKGPYSGEALARFQFFRRKVTELLTKFEALERRVRRILRVAGHPLMGGAEHEHELEQHERTSLAGGDEGAELELEEMEQCIRDDEEIRSAYISFPESSVREHYTDEEKRRSGTLFEEEEVRREGKYLLSLFGN